MRSSDALANAVNRASISFPLPLCAAPYAMLASYRAPIWSVVAAYTVYCTNGCNALAVVHNPYRSADCLASLPYAIQQADTWMQFKWLSCVEHVQTSAWIVRACLIWQVSTAGQRRFPAQRMWLPGSFSWQAHALEDLAIIRVISNLSLLSKHILGNQNFEMLTFLLLEFLRLTNCTTSLPCTSSNFTRGDSEEEVKQEGERAIVV